MQTRHRLPALFALLFLAAAPGAEATLPRPESLEPAIAFWKDVFGTWDEDYVILHDAREPWRVYEVRRLPAEDGSARRERVREQLRASWKEDLADDLARLARPGVDYGALTGRDQRIYRLWEESQDPAIYAAAARNVRSQRGIRTRFLNGVERSAAYMDEFRRIFREEGVPEEIAHLPHVESSFQWNAKSSVGAVGMWQFMRPTARRFMRVDHAVDERLDPYFAARAAARYLKEAYARLGSWPLAVTSYNHGVDGLAVAVERLGTNDIETLIRDYDGPLFGFAGRNFYVELLAASEVAESLLAEPGPLRLAPPMEYEPFVLPAYARASVLAKTFGVSMSDLCVLNPAMTPSTVKGDAYLPLGFELRLPSGRGDGAEELFAALPAKERPLEEPLKTYRVQHGDNLSVIAKRHRTSVKTLQSLNGISDPRRLRAGMVLKLP